MAESGDASPIRHDEEMHGREMDLIARKLENLMKSGQNNNLEPCQQTACIVLHGFMLTSSILSVNASKLQKGQRRSLWDSEIPHLQMPVQLVDLYLSLIHI